MTEVQLKAVKRLNIAYLRQSKEKALDLLNLRKQANTSVV